MRGSLMRSSMTVVSALRAVGSTTGLAVSGGRAWRSFGLSARVQMPARFNEGMPAFTQLKDEGIWVESSNAPSSKTAGMENLKVGIVNLMPLKEPTELQLLRMMGRSALMVDVTFIVPDNYLGKNSTPGYLEKFYKRFSEIKDEQYDGFIVTGAPIEHLPFEQVGYWGELTEFFDRMKAKDEGLLSLCWGAMATLYHFQKVPKYLVSAKLFGCFNHDNMFPKEVMMQGIPDNILIPVSRHTTWKSEDFAGKDGIKILLNSPLTGPSCVWDPKLCHVHMINHFEYDSGTLDGEYRRDLAKGTPTGEPIHIPNQYYPNDDPNETPLHTWCSAGQVFYSNWLTLLVRKKYGIEDDC